MSRIYEDCISNEDLKQRYDDYSLVYDEKNLDPKELCERVTVDCFMSDDYAETFSRHSTKSYVIAALLNDVSYTAIDCTVLIEYSAPRVAAETIAKYIQEGRQNIKILDVGAGTGIVGSELKNLGFEHIDALEPSDGMLREARKKGVYETIMQDSISENPLNVDNDSYDVKPAVAAHGQNHIPNNAVNEMVRLTKKGGYICIIGRREIFEHKRCKQEFSAACEQLEKCGKWKTIESTVFSDYFKGIDGIKFVFQVL